MINNNLCIKYDKSAVCKIYDILAKFDEEAKKPLGVDITMDACSNFEIDETTEGNE